MNNQIALMLADSLKNVHENLEGTMLGVTEEVAHFQPQGRALSIAAAYAHAVVSEDALTSTMIKEKLLIEGDWGAKLGLSVPHPMMDADWEKNFTEWSKNVKMDLPKFQEYAKAVYKRSEEFCLSMNDIDLIEKKVAFMGEWTAGKFIVAILIQHAANLTGEISAVKGLQGLKGYPM
jgi:hypothetical protein